MTCHGLSISNYVLFITWPVLATHSIYHFSNSNNYLYSHFCCILGFQSLFPLKKINQQLQVTSLRASS